MCATPPTRWRWSRRAIPASTSSGSWARTICAISTAGSAGARSCMTFPIAVIDRPGATLSFLSSVVAKTFDYARVDEGDAPRACPHAGAGLDLHPRPALVAVVERDPADWRRGRASPPGQCRVSAARPCRFCSGACQPIGDAERIWQLEPRPQPQSIQSMAAQPTPLIAIASVIVSMALIAIGNGLMFAYIPVRLGAEGFDPTWAGLIITGLSAGGLAGCILTGPLVRRVGHARAFMVLSALIALVQCRRRRRAASGSVDRRPRALRLRHMRPVHRRAELAERCRRQRHTRPGDGVLLRRLCRRARRRLCDAGAGRHQTPRMRR